MNVPIWLPPLLILAFFGLITIAVIAKLVLALRERQWDEVFGCILAMLALLAIIMMLLSGLPPLLRSQ